MAVAQVERPKRTPPPRKKAANGAPPEGPALDIPVGWQIPTGTTYWEHIAGFTSDDWTEHIAYLWMIDPIHDKRIAKGATAVDKYSRPHDLQSIKEDHGSGGYRIDFVRIARNGNAQKRIHQEYFNIFDMKYPPRLPYGEWLAYPENKKWEWCGPILLKDLNDAKAAAAGPPSQSSQIADGSAMFNTILHGIQTLRGEAGENEGLAAAVLGMVQSNQERMMDLADPVKQMATLESLLAKIAPKQDNSAMTMLFEMLREDLKAARKEMADMRAAQANNQPKDFIAQIVENAPRLKEVAALFGLGGAVGKAAGTDWGAVVATSIEKISDHVPDLIEAWKFSKAPAGTAAETGKPWRPGVVTGPAIPAKTEGAKTEASTTTAQPEPAAGSPEEAARIEEAKKKMAAADQKFGALIKAVAPILVDHFRGGMTGYDFRDWFLDRQGRLNWVALKDEVGAETLTQLAMSHQMLRAALSPPEKLYEFLLEAFTEPGKESADRIVPAGGEEETDPEAQPEGTAAA